MVVIFLSRYTEDGAYPELAAKLRQSCERFELRHDIAPVAKSESWNNTVHDKPRWIFSKLLGSREPICWLDADCEVMRLPSLLLGTAADFACYNWAADAENVGHFAYQPDRLRVSGGVLMFGYTAPAVELLNRWISDISTSPDPSGTDPVLDRTFNVHRPPVRPLWLPKSYNRHDSQWPNVEPVIDHKYRIGKHKESLTVGDTPKVQASIKGLPTMMFMFHYADLYDLAVKELAGHDKVFVEIGCWLGDSSAYMARKLKGTGTRFYCVDTWQGSEGIDWMRPYVDKCGGDMLPAWQKRMESEGLGGVATPLKMPSLEAAKRFADNSVDFVMVDGDHRYEQVKADIAAWLPKVRPGGWLTGDDYDRNSHPGVPQAVDEVLGRPQIMGRSWIYRKE